MEAERAHMMIMAKRHEMPEAMLARWILYVMLGLLDVGDFDKSVESHTPPSEAWRKRGKP